MPCSENSCFSVSSVAEGGRWKIKHEPPGTRFLELAEPPTFAVVPSKGYQARMEVVENR